MSDPNDYLWDRSGAPDEDVIALERALAPLRHGAHPVTRRARDPLRRPFAAAALVLAGAAVVLLSLPRDTGRDATAVPIHDVGAGALVGLNAWVAPETESVELAVGDVGRVTVAAGSRVQVRRAAEDVTRLYLERGWIEAHVLADARPRFFQVDTPATRCVDLGCRYTLEVDPEGNARVHVRYGQVAFENEGREVYVPAGAVCLARRDTGAGTPRWEDASEPLVTALERFDDATRAPAAERRELARAVITGVTTLRDTLSLWHLLLDRDPEVARAASQALRRVAGAPGGLQSPADAPPSAADIALWKEHLLLDWI